MLKLVGSVFLLAGFGWIGWSAANELKRRTASLRELVAALERMERDLSFRLTPMPDLCRQAGRELSGPLSHFFVSCADCAQKGEEPFWEGWRRAAISLKDVLPQESVPCLVRLGRGLGRQDSQGEIALLEAALLEFRQILDRAEEEGHRRGRLYSALGLTAGAFLVILLI